MPLFREKLFWTPFYIFLLALIFTRLPSALFYRLLTCIAITILLTDTLSARILKPLIGRARPCQMEHLYHEVLERVVCGSGQSFPSAHAANHMGLAVVLIVALGLERKYGYWLIGWALLIGFAQVYVGVHFPSDVAAGALVGGLTGLALGRAYCYLTNA